MPRSAPRLVAALAVAAVAWTVAERDAQALGPVDLEVGAKLGVGTNPDSRLANSYGFGMGGRAGLTIAHFYGGVSAVHYFGGTKEIAGQTIDASSTLLGVEVGYTIKAIPLIRLRPQVGIGNAHYSTSVDTVEGKGDDKLYLEPGLTLVIPLGLLFVGADANALLVPNVDQGDGTSKTLTALTLHAQIGLTF